MPCCKWWFSCKRRSEARLASHVSKTKGVTLGYQGTINLTSDYTSNQEYLYSTPGVASQIVAESEYQMTNLIPSSNGQGKGIFIWSKIRDMWVSLMVTETLD